MQVIPSPASSPIANITNNLQPTSSLWRDPSLRATLAARMENYSIPGLSIALIDRGQLEWAQGFGVKDTRSLDPVVPYTLFQAGSISKLVTATAVLYLVQNGTLSLDKDINAYLTSWRVPANNGWQPSITLRQLLSHTAGTTLSGFPGYPAGAPVPTLLQILDGDPPSNTIPVQVNAIPGTRFRYSGGGTTIIQQILIDVLRKPFPDLMRDLVLGPLKMANSTFEQPLPRHLQPQAAAGHYWFKNQPIIGDRHTYPEMAAAGLWTTATDLALLALDYRRALAGKPGTLLTKASIGEMLAPTALAPHVGLGLFLRGSGAAATFGHPGSDHGFVADLSASVDGDWGYAFMVNSFRGEELFTELHRAIAAEYGWPTDAALSRQPIALAEESLEIYAGIYDLLPNLQCDISVEAPNLVLHLSRQAPIRFYPQGEHRFYTTSVDAQLTFATGTSGKVISFTLKQPDGELVAARTTDDGR